MKDQTAPTSNATLVLTDRIAVFYVEKNEEHIEKMARLLNKMPPIEDNPDLKAFVSRGDGVPSIIFDIGDGMQEAKIGDWIILTPGHIMMMKGRDFKNLFDIHASPAIIKTMQEIQADAEEASNEPA